MGLGNPYGGQEKSEIQFIPILPKFNVLKYSDHIGHLEAAEQHSIDSECNLTAKVVPRVLYSTT